ncbi:unnamed protein product, partial [Trypanosoma congolense IL3000]
MAEMSNNRTKIKEMPPSGGGEFFCKYYLPNVKTMIGKGASAVVYKCTSRVTNEALAVKIIDKRLLPPSDIKNVNMEVEMMRRVGDHPHVVRLIDYYEWKTNMFVVMDLLDGGMLHDRIRSLDHYSERSASELIGNVLSGLAHIHAKGVIHRDLKAENLLLRKRSDKRDDPWLTDVCISDFGLATTGPAFSCCGTAPYIAPEVIELGYFHRSREPYDAKCDVWSLGVITYILLSGKWPFSGSCHDAIFKRIVKGKWRFSGDIWNKISAEARDFVRKCL